MDNNGITTTTTTNEQNYFQLKTNRIVNSPAIINNNNNIDINNNINNPALRNNIKQHRRFIKNNSNSKKFIWLLILLSISFIIIFIISSVYFVAFYPNATGKSIDENNLEDMAACTKNLKFENENNAISNQLEQELEQSGKYLSIYFMTWNVGSVEPRGFFDQLFATKHRLYDSYCIVLEELPMKSLFLIDEWRSELEHFFQQIDYVLLRKESSILTGLFFFVRRNHLNRYSSLKTQPVTIQSDRAFAFKGAAGLRFVYNKIQIAVIGAHLTPHDENYDKRIKDLRTIMSEISFDNASDTVYNQDLTFIFGDLNFRLNHMNKSNEEYNEHEEFLSITEFIRENQNNLENPDRFEPLLIYDQVRQALRKGEAIKDYVESPIHFPPTFKFVVGTCDLYDDKRRPAWTDRILWRNLLKMQSVWHKIDPSRIEKIELTGMYYDSLPQYTTSDHKPVRQVVWIPIYEMKRLKQDMARQRRIRRNSLPIYAAKLGIDGSHKQRIGRNLRSDQEDSPIAAALNNKLSDINVDDDALIPDKNSIWLNVDHPKIFTPSYRIEFFHIPDWNVTKKFYANFRILSNNDLDDEEERNRPVSIHDPRVKRFLSEWDWIGLFPEKFKSLNDFLTYSYPKFGAVWPTEQAEEALSMLDISDGHDSLSDGAIIDNHQNSRGDQRGKSSSPSSSSSSSSSTSTSTSSTSTSTSSDDDNHHHHLPSPSNPITDEVFSVYFDENTPILAGRYVLIYVRRNDDVIGISEPFVIERNLDFSSDFE